MAFRAAWIIPVVSPSQTRHVITSSKYGHVYRLQGLGPGVLQGDSLSPTLS